MSQENVEIVRRSVEAFNEQGLGAIAEFAHPEIEFQEPPTQPAPRTARGQEAARETWASFDAREKSTKAKSRRFYTFRDSKIVKLRPFWDRAQAIEAAGLSEPPASS